MVSCSSVSLIASPCTDLYSLAASASPLIPSSSPCKILPPSASFHSPPTPRKGLRLFLPLLLYHRATFSGEPRVGKACRAICKAEGTPKRLCWTSGSG